MTRIACFMMMKNEDDLLEPWVAYHASLFGMENLHVWDNGSTSERVRGTLDRLRREGLNVEARCGELEHFHQKGVILGEAIARVQDRYDVLLPLDCDEFVALKAGADGEIGCERDAILSAFARLAPERTVFEVDFNYPNMPGEPGRYLGWAHRKRFFARNSFAGMDHGFHEARLAEGVTQAPSPFGYIHYHYKPLGIMREHSAQKLRYYFDLARSREELRGNRLGQFLEMSEADYARFADGFAAARKYVAPAFAATLHRLGLSLPFERAPEPGRAAD